MFGEDIGYFPIRRNIHKFHFTGEDSLTDKMIVHLNVLGSGIKDEFFTNWILLRLLQ